MNKTALKALTNNPYFVYTVVLLVVVFDQLSKFIIKSTMYLYQSVPVIGDFFKLTYIENPGMAFGIQFESKLLFTVMSIVAAIVVFIYLVRMPHEKLLFRLSLALIFGGAIGNLIDRLMYGRVIDFLDFEFFDISVPAFSFLFWDFPGYAMTRWPVFNVADSAVTCGMIVLTWLILFQKSSVNQEAATEV
jgi:signal peptidase II